MPSALTLTVVARVGQRLLGSPIVRNDVRGEVVEDIVAMALEPDWELCAGDWAAFDLRHRSTGLRMQVKQSAALQSWHRETMRQSRPRFSIGEKSRRWEGDRLIREVSRNAEIFVFAWHPEVADYADHRDPNQWQFYVVPTDRLPPQQSFGLESLTKLSAPTQFPELAAAVRAALDAVTAKA